MSQERDSLKLALCTRTYNRSTGGLQGHTAQLGKELRQRGHEVRVITRALSISPTSQDFFLHQDAVGASEEDGIPVFVLRRPRWWRPWLWASYKCVWRPRFRQLGLRLYRAAYEPLFRSALGDAEFVHLIGHGADMIGFAAEAAARRAKRRFVVQSCVHPSQSGDSPTDWALYCRAGAFFTNTDFERDYFRQRVSAATVVETVYCGVEAPHYGEGADFRKKHNLHGPVVLFLGRRDADKGYPLLRQTFHLVQGAMPEATLVCAGPNVEKTTPWTGRGRVVELGWISVADKQAALEACDLLCVPSAGESFGMVFIEAGLHGKPVIGRNLPVLRELLGERECGLLVGAPSRQGNDVSVTPEELRDALLALLRNQELAARLGAIGRQRAQRFLWPNLASGYERAYESLRARPAA